MENSEILDCNKETLVNEKLKCLFNEYFLTDMQSLGAFKFIKDQFVNEKKDTDRLKKWILMKINNKNILEWAHQMQLGCPDLVPGLSIKNFWDISSFDWIKTLIDNIDTIREELISLRDKKGFQPYKSPGFASKIKVNQCNFSPKIILVLWLMTVENGMFFICFCMK